MIEYNYVTSINIRQTTASAIGTTVWSFRNTSETKIVFIKKATIVMSYDGATPLFRSTVKYSVNGFGVATPTGGTSQTPARLDSSAPASFGPDIRSLDTGLTTTSVVFGPDGTIIACPVVEGASVKFERISENFTIRLGPGEGICLRLNTAAVVGISLSGELIWSER